MAENKQAFFFLLQARLSSFISWFLSTFKLEGKKDVLSQLTYLFEALRERHMVAALRVCHANDKLGTVCDEELCKATMHGMHLQLIPPPHQQIVLLLKPKTCLFIKFTLMGRDNNYQQKPIC